jgi:hypothetical protein
MKKLLVWVALILVANSAFAKSIRCKKWNNGHETRARPQKFELADLYVQSFKYQVMNTFTDETSDKLEVEVEVRKLAGPEDFIITSLSVADVVTKLASKTVAREGARVLSTELAISKSTVEIVCSIDLL